MSSLEQANKRFVVIGNPVAHSLSPWIHAHFARQTGCAVQYERLLSPLNGFEQSVRALVACGLGGANVTVPFKQRAFELAHTWSESARFAQAANTLKFLTDGQIEAHNTDGAGLCLDLKRLLAQQGLGLEDVHVLMLGAGGAASACIADFHRAGVLELTLLNRTVAKAQVLAQRAQGLGLSTSVGPLDMPPEGVQKPVVLLNASASSLHGEVPALHPDWFKGIALAYDMMYAAKATVFLQALSARAAGGAMVLSDGLGMLVNQAALAFELWTACKPDPWLTLAQLKKHLGKA